MSNLLTVVLQVYCFPIDLKRLDSYQLKFEVVDTGANRKSAERNIGDFNNENFRDLYSVNQTKDFTHFSLKDCISNKGFEGRLLLDGEHQPPAALQVVIISHVANFLDDDKFAKEKPEAKRNSANSLAYTKSFIDTHIHDHIDFHVIICTSCFSSFLIF